MKKIKFWLGVLSVALLALVVPMGCDDGGSGDNGELDAFFKSHPYVSDPRSGGSSIVTLTPASAMLSSVGERAVFKFNGGSGAITWYVSDPAKGSVAGSGDQGVYTVTAVGVNDVIAQDRSGKTAIAKISGPEGAAVAELHAEASPSTLEKDEDVAVLTATGGTGSYTWYVVDLNKGALINGSTGSSVLYKRGNAGDSGVTVTDSHNTTVSIVIMQP